MLREMCDLQEIHFNISIIRTTDPWWQPIEQNDSKMVENTKR